MYISEQFVSNILKEEPEVGLCEGPLPICEQLQFVQEGLGTMFTTIGEWFTRYRPKDPEFQRLQDRKNLDTYRCESKYTEMKSNKQLSYESDKDNWKTQVSYDGYMRRPEYETCTMLTEYRFLKDTVDLIKRKRFTLCRGNMNVENCQQWIVTNLPEMEDDLKFIKGMLESLGKDKGLKTLNLLIS